MFGFLLEFIIVDSKSILLTNKNPNNHPSSNNRDSRSEPFPHMKPSKNPNNSPSRNNRESRPGPGACWVLVRCYRVGDCDCYTFSYKHPIKTCIATSKSRQLVVVFEVNINLITEVWIRVKLEKNHKGHCNCRVQLICSNCTQANDCNVIVADSYFIILGYTFGTTIVEKARNRREQLGHSLETPCWCRTLLRSLWLVSTCPLSLGQVPSLQLVQR